MDTHESTSNDSIAIPEPPMTVNSGDESNTTAKALQPAAANVQALTDRALQFLSTASNETLAACFLGLSATTYFIFGRLGLVLIGIVSGVVLHAAWEEGIHGGGDEQIQAEVVQRRKELGIDIVHRVLDRRISKVGKEADDESEKAAAKLAARKTLGYSGFGHDTASALNALTDAIIRDYVNELSIALAASPNASAPDAVHAYLGLKPQSSLANVLDIQHQQSKLGTVADDILQNYLEPSVFKCEPARVFLREILAKVVLEMTIQSCSKPEWINGWIVYLLEEAEPDLMNAIDAGMGGSTVNDSRRSQKHDPSLEEASSGTQEAQRKKGADHKRRVSRAEEAMDEAMQEAKRLTQLMIEEDARRQPEPQASAMSSSDDMSDGMTHAVMTPTSSQNDINEDREVGVSRNLSMNSSQEILHEPSLTTPSAPKSTFTSFDQLVLEHPSTALMSSLGKTQRDEVSQLTLHNATISIFDDSVLGERTSIRVKPVNDYLIQIEPASSHYPGWMIARKYADFETLHEIVRRISAVSGVRFTDAHSILPPWKSHTKASLRGELERYLNDAVHWQPLAESEGMKRFLEKDQGLTKSAGAANKGFGWPTPSAFENMGKGMLDVLSKAPKEVAGGGKALFGGMTGVLGGVGSLGKRGNPNSSNLSLSIASPSPRADNSTSDVRRGRKSQDSLRSSPIRGIQTSPSPQKERQPSWNRDVVVEGRPRPSSSSQSSGHGRPSRGNSTPPSLRHSSDTVDERRQPPAAAEQAYQLPPPPSEIPDDYGIVSSPTRRIPQSQDANNVSIPRASTESLLPKPPGPGTAPHTNPQSKAKPPITEQETQVAVELLFAVVNELYTLSSAWNIRRTLLTAAKTFLLRPGNPQLESIRLLLQDTVIDANTSDAGIAAHIRKLRENTLPTEEELKAWPPPLQEEEKEALRMKARRLLVEKGMPQALTSVMGAAASGEAMGKLFDCLQVGNVARGLIFGLLLQAVRAVAQ
ncbi:hypothetical protein LTR04_000016 [Oleoguttula sp. CCFEE 6159]|nr:hypothetical protein LTR04_000016 [Oleoguttula sp. CCFEE 6159]